MKDNNDNLENVTAEDYKSILPEANMETIIEALDYLQKRRKTLDDLQKYRELEDRLYAIFGDAISLQDVVDNLEYKLKEPGKQHPINAKILTYEDAAKWEQYKSIGTPEECRRAIEKQKTVSSFDNFDVRR